MGKENLKNKLFFLICLWVTVLRPEEMDSGCSCKF